MASGTSDLIVRLSLDTTQFEGSVSKFEGQMTKMQASCTNAATENRQAIYPLVIFKSIWYTECG